MITLTETTGKYLDSMALLYGLKRRRSFVVFRESDINLRLRIKRLISSLHPVHIKEVDWKREGYFYVARLEYQDGRVKHTFVRTLDFFSYHLIKLIHGQETLLQMANARHRV